MILALPAELRLRIAEFAFEQRATAGIPYMDRHLQEQEQDYRPSQNLALLLVCRRFHNDFTALAYNKTRFVLWNSTESRLRDLPVYKLSNIRKLAYYFEVDAPRSWGSYFCNLDQLNLDELVFLCPHQWAGRHTNIKNAVSFLRRLLHVRVVKFVMFGKGEGLNRAPCYSLIGTIMKEDHFHRYDALDAPNTGITAWDWHLNAHENSVTLQANQPEPVCTEEEYMLLMKPKVDALMAIAQQEAGL